MQINERVSFEKTFSIMINEIVDLIFKKINKRERKTVYS
jgi:hypothetical protein